MDDCQEYIWDKINLQTYISRKNDCSNKCYQLWYWWSCLYPENNYNVYLVDSNTHCQLEWMSKGFYDPAKHTKIETGAFFKLKPASKAKKLPSYAKFQQYVSVDYMNGSKEFSVSEKNYDKMLKRILNKGWQIKNHITPNVRD